MTVKRYNKLVRDNIPHIITADDAKPTFRVLDYDEYRVELLKKLVEEAKELLESNGFLDERADVQEVLRSIDEVCGFSASQIEEARAEKAQQRGGFNNRIYLENVITRDREAA